MQINYAPSMTAFLVGKGAFRADPFTLVDVGALGGIQGHWAVFGKDLRVIAFEPNQAECRRLQSTADPRITYLPFGLGARDEVRTLYIHRNPSSSSIFPYDRKFIERFPGPETTEVVGEEEIRLRRMDDVLAGFGDIDFIKLDAEGAELEIMSAGKETLAKQSVLGLMTEIRFHKGSGTPLFWEIERIVRAFGYDLYDLDCWRMSRKDLPYPLLYDFRHDRDYEQKIFGATIGGQLFAGDALYLRDYAATRPDVSATKVLKLACLFEIFEQVDCAAELIFAYRGAIDQVSDHRQLIEALVPKVRGRKPSYAEYIQRYFSHDPAFRPTVPGKRFPEPIIAHFDGKFIPPWSSLPKAALTNLLDERVRGLALWLIRGRRSRALCGKLVRLVAGRRRTDSPTLPSG